MGGAWNALKKSVNRTLKAIARDRFFTEEVLHTFNCEVESISNNRSITSSSDEINNYEALTPNYILLGYSSSNYAPGVFRVNEINYRRKIACHSSSNQRVLESLAQGISTNVNVGNLFAIQTDNIPWTHWPLSRIIKIYPGVDGAVQTVRTVKVKTLSNRAAQNFAY